MRKADSNTAQFGCVCVLFKYTMTFVILNLSLIEFA